MAADPLQDLKTDVADLCDVFDPYEVLEAVQEGFNQAAERAAIPDNIEFLETLSDALKNVKLELWDE